MYIEQFVYLKAVSQTGSLRAASEQVFVTEQAMSSAIRKLEKECGVSLLRRSNKGVSLTEHGQYVLEKADVILQSIEDIQKHFSVVTKSALSLHVMAGAHLMENLLSPIMMYYNQFVPTVQLIAKEGEFDAIIDAVKSRACDVGVVSVYVVNGKPVNRLDPTIQYDEIFSMPIYIAVAPQSPLLEDHDEKVSYEELANYPAIVKVSAYEKNDYVLKRAMQAGKNKILYATNSKMARLMLKDNMGWMISPMISELEQNNQIHYLALEEEVASSVGVCYLKKNEKFPQIENFIRYFKQLCEQEYIHAAD